MYHHAVTRKMGRKSHYFGAYVDLIQHLRDEGTFTRASTKTYIGPAGTRLTASANENPNEYDPSTLEDIGPSFWGARTNFLLNSGSPATQAVSVANAAQYTLWVEGSGSATVSGGGAGSATEGSPLVFTTTGTSITVTVNGSLDIFQLEAGGFPSPYIPTSGATATRAADVAVIGGAAFSAVWPIASMFCVLRNVADPSATSGVFSANDGSANNQSDLRLQGSEYRALVASGGVTQASQGAGVATSESVSVAVAFETNRVALSADGNAVSTDSSALMPSGLNQMDIGQLSTGAFFLNGNIKTLRGYPRALTDEQLRAVTS